jgi:hypothetical protein
MEPIRQGFQLAIVVASEILKLPLVLLGESLRLGIKLVAVNPQLFKLGVQRSHIAFQPAYLLDVLLVLLLVLHDQAMLLFRVIFLRLFFFSKRLHFCR